MSKVKNSELCLKRKPNSWFVNNYFDLDLKAFQAIWINNLFLMSITQRHKFVYISRKLKITVKKTMKQAAKEVFDNNMHHHDTMKIIAKAN